MDSILFNSEVISTFLLSSSMTWLVIVLLGFIDTLSGVSFLAWIVYIAPSPQPLWIIGLIVGITLRGFILWWLAQRGQHFLITPTPFIQHQLYTLLTHQPWISISSLQLNYKYTWILPTLAYTAQVKAITFLSATTAIHWIMALSLFAILWWMIPLLGSIHYLRLTWLGWSILTILGLATLRIIVSRLYDRYSMKHDKL